MSTRLKARWTQEMAQDLNAFCGLDASAVAVESKVIAGIQAIEIRAAELYAMGPDAFLHLSLSEMRGWFDNSFDVGPPIGPYDNVPTFGDITGWHAGWLARQMLESE